MSFSIFNQLKTSTATSMEVAEAFAHFQNGDQIGFENLTAEVKPYYDFDSLMIPKDNYDDVAEYLVGVIGATYEGADIKVSQCIRPIESDKTKVSFHFVCNGYRCRTAKDVHQFGDSDTTLFNEMFKTTLVNPHKNLFDNQVYGTTQKFRGLFMKKDETTPPFIPFQDEEVTADDYHMWFIQNPSEDDAELHRAVVTTPQKIEEDVVATLGKVQFDEFKSMMDFIKEHDPDVTKERNLWFQFISASIGTMNAMGYRKRELLNYLTGWSLSDLYPDEDDVYDSISEIVESSSKDNTKQFGFIKTYYNKLNKATQSVLDNGDFEIVPRSHHSFVMATYAAADIESAYSHLLSAMVRIGPSVRAMYFRTPENGLERQNVADVAPKGKGTAQICGIPINTFYNNVINSVAFKKKCTFADTQYYPYTEFETPAIPNFNNFKCFPFKYIESPDVIPEEPKIISRLRNHFEDDDALSYFVAWMAALVQTPRERISALILVSPQQGVGKSQIQSMLENLIGFSNTYTSNSLDSLFNNFNAHLDTTLLVNCNEIGQGCRTLKSNMEKLKSFCTDRRLNIEGKGKDIKTIDNYTHWVFSTNYSDCMKLQAGDRRFSMIPIKMPPGVTAGDANYFPGFIKDLEDPENLSELFNYLMRHKSDINLNKPFECQVRREAIVDSTHEVLKLLYRLVHNDIDIPDDIDSSSYRIEADGLTCTSTFISAVFYKNYSTGRFSYTPATLGKQLKDFGLENNGNRINTARTKTYGLKKSDIVAKFMETSGIRDKELIDRVLLGGADDDEGPAVLEVFNTVPMKSNRKSKSESESEE